MAAADLTRDAVNVLPEGELERKLKLGRPLRVKLGIDATSPDIHLGFAYVLDRLSCPVILLQGLEDPVVPPAQAEAMAAALERKGIPYEYLAFEGEQHGFRKAENIKRSLDAELYFYGRIFGFEPADEIEPVKIENL